MNSKPILIPDIRFEQTFMNSLKKAALQQHKSKIEALKNSGVEFVDTEDIDPPITTSMVLKVILKDVLFLPMLQGLLWTGLMIAMKPWLRACARSSFYLSQYMIDSVLGRSILRNRTKYI